jgi:hypothetical protein
MAEDGKQPEVDDGTHSEVARIPYDPDRKIYEADDVAASEVDLSELPDDSPRDTMEEYDRDLAPVVLKPSVPTERELLVEILRRLRRIEGHLGIDTSGPYDEYLTYP